MNHDMEIYFFLTSKEFHIMCSLGREFLQISAKNLCRVREMFIVVQYRCYFILIFSLYFRTQSGTIFLCTASSCAFKMKELASHLGGWSTLMRQSQENLREGEHPILTMVSYTESLNFYSFSCVLEKR